MGKKQCVKCLNHGEIGYGWCAKRQKSVVPKMYRTCSDFESSGERRSYSNETEYEILQYKTHLEFED